VSVYLIDGYNVLHEVLGHGGVLQLEDERRRLIDRIASYMGGTSDRAIVVFDGKGQMLQKGESATANVEVYFGSFSRSADSIPT
jgi:predicted RNA-binding protein with PIN domain